MYGGETQARGGCFDRQKLLREHPLFSGLPAEIIERLSSYAIMKDVKRGTTIFTKAKPATACAAVRVRQDDQPLRGRQGRRLQSDQ